MVQYTPLNAVLDSSYVPAALKKEADEDTMLSYGLDAYRLLNLPLEYQAKICIKPIINHSVELPSDIHSLEMVTYLPELPAEMTGSDNLLPISTDTDYNIFYKIWAINTSESNKYFPLRNVGNGSNINCNACHNSALNRCSETFSILPSKSLLTSIKDGYVCLNYSGEIKDVFGNFMIINSTEIKRYIGLYIQSQIWLSRASSKEEQAFSMYKELLRMTELAMRKARGIQIMKSISVNEISQITGTDTYNQRLIRSGNDFYKKYSTNG